MKVYRELAVNGKCTLVIWMRENNKSIIKRALWGGVFLIGLGIIFLADLPWESILILLGAIILLDGLIRYYLGEKRGERP
ncbi:hypothetical protein DRN86_00750 [Candidatus Geothermarchaeota archaeon]|nr:MAG: hypothetical protein DRN86_00750 [Candidatus Geothermarchaeota archaeon]